MSAVVSSYAWSSLWVAAAIAVSWVTAMWLTRRWPHVVTKRLKFVLVIAGSALLLVAGVAELGWGSSIITMEGDSVPEKLNKSLFWVFSMTGGFLVFLELFLAFLTRGKE